MNHPILGTILLALSMFICGALSVCAQSDCKPWNQLCNGLFVGFFLLGMFSVCLILQPFAVFER